MKTWLVAVAFCGLLGGMGHGVPCAKADSGVVVVMHVPSDSQLSAMFGQVAPQLSTQLQRVVTVAELHEGYGNGVVKVYYRGVDQDGLQRWEVQYGGGSIVASLDDEI